LTLINKGLEYINKISTYINTYLNPNVILGGLNTALNDLTNVANQLNSALTSAVAEAQRIAAAAAAAAEEVAHKLECCVKLESCCRRSLSMTNNYTALERRRLDAVSDARDAYNAAASKVTNAQNLINSFNNGDLPGKINSAISTVTTAVTNFKITYFHLALFPTRFTLCYNLAPGSTDTCYYDVQLPCKTSLAALGLIVYQKVTSTLLDLTGVSLARAQLLSWAFILYAFQACDSHSRHSIINTYPYSQINSIVTGLSGIGISVPGVPT